MTKEDLDKRIKHLDGCIAKASKASVRALQIHRDALAKVLEKYIPYEHEGPKIRTKRAHVEVEKT